jgi:hypothetical protein
MPSGSAFYPTGASNFPADGFRNGILYVGGETTSGKVFRVILNGQDHAGGIVARQFASFLQPAYDLTFGPDGMMYVATQGILYRIRYSGNQSANDPIASAGPDVTRDEGTQVTLSAGLSTDADVGTTLTFAWRQTGGSPTVTLTNATTVNATFTAPLVSFNQVLTFEVIVEDGFGGVDTDTVSITVHDIVNTGGGDGSKRVGEEGGCTTGGAGVPLATVAMLGVLVLRRRRVVRGSQTFRLNSN